MSENMVEDLLSLDDGTKVWYSFTAGRRDMTPVVFVHGNAQNHTSGSPLMNFFHSLGHPVLTYDLPGHGRSAPYEDKVYSMERFAKTLDILLKKNGIDKAIFVGHSMGGMIVLQHVSVHSETIAALVLLGTSDVDPAKVNKVIPISDIVEGIIKQAYDVYDKNLQGDGFRFDADLSEEEITAKGLPRTVPEALEGNFRAAVSFDVTGAASSLDVPVLIVRGSDDPLMTDDMNKAMHGRISGSRFVTLPGVGHNFLVTSPAVLISIVKENYDYIVGR